MGKSEDLLLKGFQGIATSHSYSVFRGQGNKNRIRVTGNAYFQFGDLRVDVGTRYVVVEVESAGGITNLAKYWYCLANELIDKPLVLIHLFSQSSKDDYASHLALWDFAWAMMKEHLSGRVEARCYTYGNLQAALDDFRHCLERP